MPEQTPVVEGTAQRLDELIEAELDRRFPLINGLERGEYEAVAAAAAAAVEPLVRGQAATLQRVRELAQELRTTALAIVDRSVVVRRLDAALGVGVPTEYCGCETDRHERTERECPNFHFQRHSPHVWNNGHHVCYGWPRDTTSAPVAPGPLLPVPENPPTEYPCPHARPSWRQCPWCLGVNGPVTSVDPPKETE